MNDDEYIIRQVGNSEEDEELRIIRKKIIRYRLGIIIETLIILVVITILISIIFKNNNCNIREYEIDPKIVSVNNSQFTNYAGIQNGAQVKNLCNLIRGRNLEHTDDANLNIGIQYGEGIGSTQVRNTELEKIFSTEEVEEIKSKIKAGNRYNVKFGYSEGTGRIVDCCIEKINMEGSK